VTTSSIRASRKQLGQGLDGACHTIVESTPTARVELVVTFAGLASADNKVADYRTLDCGSGMSALPPKLIVGINVC
jgi:hypothetical protein